MLTFIYKSRILLVYEFGRLMRPELFFICREDFIEKIYTNYADQVAMLAEKGAAIKNTDFVLRLSEKEDYYNATQFSFQFSQR